MRGNGRGRMRGNAATGSSRWRGPARRRLRGRGCRRGFRGRGCWRRFRGRGCRRRRRWRRGAGRCDGRRRPDRNNRRRVVTAVERERPALEATRDRVVATRAATAECPRPAVRSGPVPPVRGLWWRLLALLGVPGVVGAVQWFVSGRPSGDPADKCETVLSGADRRESGHLECLDPVLHLLVDAAHDDPVVGAAIAGLVEVGEVDDDGDASGAGAVAGFAGERRLVADGRRFGLGGRRFSVQRPSDERRRAAAVSCHAVRGWCRSQAD